ncbi:putative zinc metalloproteinase [Ceratocystis platani]|uniref:Putative zinc metalloproteinase n=1 Tax=Ceratocystis fimbriata f. sp. platani TaxID=88771 RepID=A0A0F8DLM0_CERFI|nr:putative zinc metalloproteinase [Ceratocystis platani]
MTPTGAPPVQLAILLASDSPETFDCPPERVKREGNDLEVAIRKFRMSAYLWQAFTAEQMLRNKLGRRVFRFDEEWTSGSASSQDREQGTMRSEARIHIIRSDKTTAEIRDLNIAQQHGPATDKGALYDITTRAVFSVEVGSVAVRAISGVAVVEIRVEGEEICRAWIEYPLDSNGAQRQVSIYESDVRLRLPESHRQKKLQISVKSIGGGSVDIDNFEQMCSKSAFFKLDTGKMASRSQYLGRFDEKQIQDVVFTSSVKPDRIMSKMIVHSGLAVDGLEFVYDDSSSQLFGQKGGTPNVFEFDVRRGEYISGFLVRSGAYIDAVQIMTSLGRKSGLYGNAHGGSAHCVIPPRGYTIRGVSGSSASWLDSFSVIISK